MGKPTIYRRWPSKPELVLDAVKRLAPPFPTADTGDPLTDLRQVVPELLVGAPVYCWLVTARPVDAEASRRFVDAVWDSLRSSAS